MQLIESARIPSQCAFTTEKAIYIKHINIKLLNSQFGGLAMIESVFPRRKSLWNSKSYYAEYLCLFLRVQFWVGREDRRDGG